MGKGGRRGKWFVFQRSAPCGSVQPPRQPAAQLPPRPAPPTIIHVLLDASVRQANNHHVPAVHRVLDARGHQADLRQAEGGRAGVPSAHRAASTRAERDALHGPSHPAPCARHSRCACGGRRRTQPPGVGQGRREHVRGARARAGTRRRLGRQCTNAECWQLASCEKTGISPTSWK